MECFKVNAKPGLYIVAPPTPSQPLLKSRRFLHTTKNKNAKDTVCPKLFGTPKMDQNGPQMSNYCAQLPPHTLLYIHGRPQIQKSPYGYTQGPKFIFFQNARIQTNFEGVKKHTSNSTRSQ